MKIIIIRHGKVNYNWNKWYNSEGFDQVCREYDEAPIVEEQYIVPDMEVSESYNKRTFENS